MADDRTRLQALSLINDCHKYIMPFNYKWCWYQLIHTQREKLTSTKEEDKESEEPDNDEDKAKRKTRRGTGGTRDNKLGILYQVF